MKGTRPAVAFLQTQFNRTPVANACSPGWDRQGRLQWLAENALPESSPDGGLSTSPPLRDQDLSRRFLENDY